MRVVVIGASAGLGLELSNQLAQLGHDLVLVASDARDLRAIAANLSITCAANITTIVADLNMCDPKILADQCINSQAVDAVFLIAGLSNISIDNGVVDNEFLMKIIKVNFTSLMSLANAFLPSIEKSRGDLVGIGSVASIRPRKKNIIYSASKTGLEFYFDSLRHLYAFGSCKIRFYRVGFMKTSMIFGQRTIFPALPPSSVARVLIQDLGKSKYTRYLPGWWLFVAILMRMLPWFIYKRLNI